MAGGGAIFQVGAGEAKQTRPFGWKRSEGLARLEDQFRLFRAFWESEEPVDFDGNVWTMRRAWLGNARIKRPQMWALGGGPKLLDLATSYADGFAASTPSVYDTPEQFAQLVKQLKEDLERKGRDPEAFGFGLWFLSAIHDDAETIDRAFVGPVMKWLASSFGRLDQRDWRRIGVEPVYPDDWHYSIKLRPIEVTEAQSADVLARTTPELVRASYVHGAPAEVASEVQAYVDAGCTYASVCDILPLALAPADAQGAIARSIDVCRHLKRA